MNKAWTILGVALAAAMLVISHGATSAQQGAQRKQYVYILHLTPRMQNVRPWTDAESGVISQHFARLAKAAEAGKVILAGRTTETPDKAFGLVIFEAESDDDARRFMESDPAVVADIMTATLHPYAAAPQQQPLTHGRGHRYWLAVMPPSIVSS